jgi:hypothetical protein
MTSAQVALLPGYKVVHLTACAEGLGACDGLQLHSLQLELTHLTYK